MQNMNENTNGYPQANPAFNAPAAPVNRRVALANFEVEDRGGFLWGLLGFLSPIMGIIFFLFMRISLPRNARAVKIGIIIALVAFAVLLLLYIVIIALAAASASTLY